MMNERKGVVFSIPEENLPVEGCTISKEVAHERDYHLFYFSTICTAQDVIFFHKM